MTAQLEAAAATIGAADEIAAGSAVDATEKHARRLGRRGDLLRSTGRVDRAVAMLTEAVRLGPPNSALQRANRLRLATARFYDDDHVTAEREFRRLLAELTVAGDDRYLGFCWQHLGKCLAEMSRWAEAIDCFERALALRSGGDAELIRSTEQALAAARDRLGRLPADD